MIQLYGCLSLWREFLFKNKQKRRVREYIYIETDPCFQTVTQIENKIFSRDTVEVILMFSRFSSWSQWIKQFYCL